jgi:site-specific DNA-methyltransferase (adenine-specific)
VIEPYYTDEWVTLYHGDCGQLLQGLLADAVLTDPPYGVGLKYDGDYRDNGGPAYSEWILSIFAQMRLAAPLVALTAGVRNIWLYPQPTWILCWAKPGSTRRSDLGGFNCWEPILLYGKRRISQDYVHLPTAPNLAQDAAGSHPCPKPLRLMRWLVTQITDEGQSIIDPFAGSGTTLRAAKDSGRRAIGIELEERYCEIAAKRLSQGVLDFGEVSA